MRPKIAISMGDFNGIGPEVVLKHLSSVDLSVSTPVIIGSEKVFQFYESKLNIRVSRNQVSKTEEIKDDIVNILIINEPDSTDIQPTKITEAAGKAAMRAVEYGINSCLAHKTDALVTAPISKEAIHKAGYHYPGHTEFLAEKTGTDYFMMILATDQLRVGLLTGHIPLKDVAQSIQKDTIIKKLESLHTGLKENFGIKNPKIAVLGLNPHAGDGGVLGTEEIETIIPAINLVKRKGIEAEGPYPADGFFGSQKQNQFDAVLAMYHDQGLIPFKTLSFGKGVNFTAGLPIIRTSPDHGTAYDIAGLNRANPDSFSAAYNLAVDMAQLQLEGSTIDE
jgi:4-hydroxythreonine-4-phosphate dehydrogenase